MVLSIYNFGQIALNESFYGDSSISFAGLYGWSGNMIIGYPSDISASSGCDSGRCLINTSTTDGINNIIYTTNHSNATALNYSFRYFMSNSSTNISGSMSVAYSLDGGSTWTNSGNSISLSTIVGAPTFCDTVSGVIPAGIIPVGANFKFRIQIKNTMVSNASNFKINIDDIKLEQTSFSIPSCTNIYSPSNGTPTFALDNYFQWSPSAGATGYLFSLGTTPNGTDILNNINVGNRTNYPNITTLKYSTQYFVTVVPYNSFGNSSCNVSSSFTTSSINCPNPTIENRGGMHWNAYTNLYWTNVSQATGYKITLGTTPNGAEVYDDLDIGNVNSFLIPTGLLFNTQYYLKLIAYNNESISIGCNELTFKRDMPCYKVLQVSPVGDYTSLTPKIVWAPHTAVIPTGGFRLSVGKYIGATGNINNIIDNLDVGYVSSYQLTTSLEPNTKYFFQIEGYNYMSEHNTCPIITFKTTPYLGTSEFQNDINSIKLYPNPTKDFIIIDTKNKIKSTSIVDFSGRRLHQFRLDNNKIDLRDFSKGNYILQIQFSDGSVYNKTITKE